MTKPVKRPVRFPTKNDDPMKQIADIANIIRFLRGCIRSMPLVDPEINRRRMVVIDQTNTLNHALADMKNWLYVFDNGDGA